MFQTDIVVLLQQVNIAVFGTSPLPRCIRQSVARTGRHTRLIVETLEPSIIYLFPRDMIQKLAKENWEINMFYQKILEYSLIVSQIKADSWRFESARERYNLLLETHPEIIKRAPLAHIASYLLMTPETLSRVRSGVL